MGINYPEIKNVPATFTEMAKQRKDQVAMRHKDYGLWQEITWSEYYLNSVYVAHALMKIGVERGDFVGIIGENGPQWLFMDMGIQLAGAVTVGIYTTSAWQQVQYILEHSECKILFAEDEEQVDKWLQMRGSLPQLKKVIYWEKKGLERMNDPDLVYFEEFIREGENSFKLKPGLHVPRVEAVNPDDTAILVYTSGTTGHPKGVMLTGRNLLWVAHTIASDKDSFIKDTDETMSFLPLCHIFERMFSVYLPLVLGFKINFAESPETIFQNLREIRPTIGYAVPRVWEKMQSQMIIRISDARWFNRWAFSKATDIAGNYTDKKLRNEDPGAGLRFLYFFAYWLVLFPLKYMLGINRMRFAISGAAAISPKILRFYHSIGITMAEAYGMTETSCIITYSTPNNYKLGTVGKVVPGGELKINSDQEILVRHPGVTLGYYKNPTSTIAALEDGWLHTGDLGVMDEAGYLKIVDRKKDLIITSGGKNIAPQLLENKLKVSPYINDAIIIGDKRKFISAIIVLDEENINKYARDKKIHYTSYVDLATHPEVFKLIEKEVQQVNGELARVESIRKFTILDKRLYVEDGEVTPTMKVKRKYINEQYSDLIESMYNN